MALGMLRISEPANLAIHAMLYIAVAGSDKKHLVAEIAAKQGVSRSSLSKVMVRLARVGLLASRTGRRGGFVLGRSADRIMLLEIYEAIDGPLGRSRCLRGDRCRQDDCALSDMLDRVQEEVRQSLSSTRLSDMMAQVQTCGIEMLARDSVVPCQQPIASLQASSGQ